jgi:enoyl-CoA hydratase
VTAPVQARTEGRVRHLTLDRPHALNALNAEVLALLAEELAAVRDDPALGAVLIDGAGGRAFCAGADLSELQGADPSRAHGLLRRGQLVMAAIEALPIPVIAAVDGHALGGGCELALACPLVLASDRSSFGLPEAKLGLVPGFGGTVRLRRSIGRGPAMAMMLTGRPIPARTAWQLGLLSAPPEKPDDLPATAAALAAEVAELSRVNLALVLESARSWSESEEALRHEAALSALAISSRDGQEGITAFLAKRSPSFDRG